MPFDITKELQKTFDEAVMRHEAKSLKKPEDWQQARKIREHGAKERAGFEDKYNREYDTRHEIVRKRLIKEAGERKLTHPNPGMRDKLDGEALGRQAHREVRLDHKRVMQQSRDKQKKKMSALIKSARGRDRPQVKLKEQFAQAKDQRQSPDRRAPPRSR